MAKNMCDACGEHEASKTYKSKFGEKLCGRLFCSVWAEDNEDRTEIYVRFAEYPKRLFKSLSKDEL